MTAQTLTLPGETETHALGAALAHVLAASDRGAAIELHGELGAGKTTLARALIHALGHDGPVISPTYTLVEPYELAGRRLLHLDLYRIADPEELEYLGWREWDAQRDWLLVEWAERGSGFLPEADLQITLNYETPGRSVRLAPRGTFGAALVEQLMGVLAPG